MQQSRSFIEHCRDAWMRKLPWAERSTRRMRIVETLLLPDRRSLVIVDCEGKRLLLGSTPAALSLLAEFDAQGGCE